MKHASALAGCVFSAAFLSLVPGCSADRPPAQGSESTTTAPDFSARDLSGRTIHLGSYLGQRAVLLDFWATYCEPCKSAFPHLVRLHEREKQRGLVVLGIALDGPETAAEVPALVRRYGLPFPVIVDADSQVAALYNPKRAAPFEVLIDKHGRVAYQHEGYNPGDEETLAGKVAEVLGP